MNTFLCFPLLCAAALAADADPVPAPKDAPLDAKYLRDHAATRGFLLGRPVQAKPTPDGKAVLFLRAKARVPKLKLYEFDFATGKTRELLTPEQVLKGAEEHLTPEEKARRERQRVSVGGFTSFQFSEDGSLILLSLSGKLYVIPRSTGEIHELKTSSGTILDPKFSPDGKQVAYILDHDLFVYDLATDKEHRVTTGGAEKKTHGLAEFVAQEEMHRFSGYWWSPEAKFIGYEEADADGVETWYVADPIKPEQPAFPSFYPRPGKANVKVRLGIVPVAGGETVWVDWDREKYPYMADVRWDKPGPLTVTVQSRLQNEVLLLLVDPKTGKTTPLAKDTDIAWVNIRHDTPRWANRGKWLLWTANGPFDAELQLLDPTGKEKPRTLVPLPAPRAQDGTPKRIYFLGLVDVSEDGREIIFLGTTDTTNSQLYRLTLNADGSPTGWPTPITSGPGVHSATYSKDHSVYVLTATTLAAMPKTTVHKADGTLIGELPSVAEEPPITPKAEMVQADATIDGIRTAYHAAIIRPHGFDPKKKYPVIVDVYGGPGHQAVLEAERNWLLDQWLADQGFIVVAIDNRGTPGRGRDWERALYKKFGSVPLEDQIAGLQALGKKYPELDLERVGITGWSFGGYMSALAVLKRPDIFKAAVAGAPVVAWEDYDTHYTERYLGLPKDSPDAYKEASLLTYAVDLKRPLLLIHGTADDNVYFRHTLRLIDALFRAGKDFEVLPLTGFTHMVPDPVVTERLHTRIAQYFQKHLGKAEGK
jgi:dipeptidyl-peptidase-4